MKSARERSTKRAEREKGKGSTMEEILVTMLLDTLSEEREIIKPCNSDRKKFF